MVSNFFRKDQENKVRSEGRLPPGQALTQKFPVLHYGPVPGFNPATWDFRVWGEVAKPIQWSWEEFNKLPRVQVTLDIHCVTRWSKFDTTWEGVSLKVLIQNGLIEPLPSAKFVIQHAEHGYTTNMPIEMYLQDNFIMATHFNGEVLTPEHGFPLRGVVGAIPEKRTVKDVYFWKGAKWLRGLEFSAQDKPGFWEQAGYHNEADVWKEERFGHTW